MPTYGYRCPACSTEFEVWQRMSDEPGATCPSCGAAARRLFYPAGIVFKGAGFYATDSRASSTASSAPSSGSADATKSTPTTPGTSSGGSNAASSNSSSTPAPSGTP